MIQPNEDYQPSWQMLLRDVHDVDKRLTILEATQIHTTKALDEIKADARETSRTLHQVRDAVVGWKSGLAVIISVSGAIAAVVFFLLGKIWQ